MTPISRSIRPLPAAVLALLLLALAPRPASGLQIEEEELPLGEWESLATVELADLLTRAEEMFHSEQQAEAIPIFNEAIEHFETKAATIALSAEERAILVRCLALRAEAHFNLGENDATTQDLRKILSEEPGFRLDPDRVSPKLADLLGAQRRELVGYLVFLPEPADAGLEVDGHPLLAGAGRIAVLAGRRKVRIERPGYDRIEKEVDVPADRDSPLEVSLERTSATVQIETSPGGATVLLDGQVAGVTPQVAGEAESTADSSDDSSRLVIDGLTAGKHGIEVRLDGFRSHQVEVNVEALDDYTLPPVVLVRTGGTLLVRALPEGADLFINGRKVSFSSPDGEPLRLEELPVGRHRLLVSAGTTGRYVAAFALEDRETFEAEVLIRPALVFLGVVGGDETAGRRLEAELKGALNAVEDLVLLDRSPAGGEFVQQRGVGPELMRQLAKDEPTATAQPDWTELQRSLDGEYAGSIYLLAVLSDDLVASHADVWLWSATGGPERPERRQITFADSPSFEAVVASFRPPAFERSWFGAVLIDSEVAPGVVIMSTVPGGPADTAGLAPGDEIVRLGGDEIQTHLQLAERLVAMPPGSTVELEIQGKNGTRRVELTLGSTPAVLPAIDRATPLAVIAATAAAELSRPNSATPRWLLALNRAAVFLEAGNPRRAVQVLRDLAAPPEPGLGQGAIDYWLGVALLAHDRTAYLDTAREALTRAAANDQARLHHHDGPFVAPRARALLADLENP